MEKKVITIGIVAGEYSGDLIAAQLMQALWQQDASIQFVGICGPSMRKLTMHSLFPMEKICAFGLVEVLRHLPRILYIRYRLKKYFQKNPPDLFIGIDAPDFNFNIEYFLKNKLKVQTVHYNSPTVWAWRPKRVFKIARATDLLLTLFPFEAKYYQGLPIKVCYIGHPMADQLPLHADHQNARAQLAIAMEQKVIALLPGSRLSELNKLSAVFIRTAKYCFEHNPNLLFLAPMVSSVHAQQFSKRLQVLAPQLPIRILMNESERAITAADCVLLASGTATLETMLLSRPMVVAYRVSNLSYWLAKKLIKIPYIALPNILAGRSLVPEYIQKAATVENLGTAVLNSLNQDNSALIAAFTQIRVQLQCQASKQAAQAIIEQLSMAQT